MPNVANLLLISGRKGSCKRLVGAARPMGIPRYILVASDLAKLVSDRVRRHAPLMRRGRLLLTWLPLVVGIPVHLHIVVNDPGHLITLLLVAATTVGPLHGNVRLLHVVVTALGRPVTLRFAAAVSTADLLLGIGAPAHPFSRTRVDDIARHRRLQIDIAGTRLNAARHRLVVIAPARRRRTVRIATMTNALDVNGRSDVANNRHRKYMLDSATTCSETGTSAVRVRPRQCDTRYTSVQLSLVRVTRPLKKSSFVKWVCGGRRMSGETFVRAALRPVQTNVAGGQGKVGPVRAPRRGKENRRASSVVQPARTLSFGEK